MTSSLILRFSVARFVPYYHFVEKFASLHKLSFSSHLRHFTTMSSRRCCCEGLNIGTDINYNSIERIFPNGTDVFSTRPKMMDSHCHIQLTPLYDIRLTIINNANSVGVSHFSVCGVCPGNDWQLVQSLVSEYPNNIIGNFGLHPWWIRQHIPVVGSDDKSWVLQLEDMLALNSKAGVGECGLDKNIVDTTSLEEQEVILTEHIRLSVKYNRPLTIHCVGYWAKLLEILKREFQVSNKKNRVERDQHPPIILHSCNSMPVDLVTQFLKINCPIYFSLSGGGSAEKSSKLVQAIPRQYLLLETDSPDQLSSALKNSSLNYNEPCMVRHYCDIYASILGIESDELAQQVMSNCRVAFAACL